jgi:hypothetical protein
MLLTANSRYAGAKRDYLFHGSRYAVSLAREREQLPRLSAKSDKAEFSWGEYRLGDGNRRGNLNLDAGKPQDNRQAAVLPVLRPNFAVMQADRSLGECEPDAESAGIPLARVINTVKRLEDIAQLSFRQPGPPIAHLKNCRVFTRLPIGAEIQFNDRSVLRVANGIANNILDRTIDELGISAYRTGAGGMQIHSASSLPCLKFRIGQHFFEELVERKLRLIEPGIGGLHRREAKQVANELIEPAGLALDPLELISHVSRGLLTGQFQSDAKPRQG